ncbi:unnamed protein product [Vitrella brassicaformis CCMP3155]|uniref:Uncharacterized protein n=1 Tax=Vitrella brassicaformis (strain CCMP3155) TaxID=1169540 RepID=A0A0G4EZZ1_VITBC|nr:unnamed protein product [Vitrella brassicaformis CCMP3155]|eukprot:CEM04405.1 unnamed protein product [Vitrella brassicaformis CCMP3155]
MDQAENKDSQVQVQESLISAASPVSPAAPRQRPPTKRLLPPFQFRSPRVSAGECGGVSPLCGSRIDPATSVEHDISLPAACISCDPHLACASRWPTLALSRPSQDIPTILVWLRE